MGIPITALPISILHLGSLDVLVLPIGQGAFVDLEGLTQEFPREMGHLGHWMSEGVWGLVQPSPGSKMWKSGMAFGFFGPSPGFPPAFLGLPPSSLSSFSSFSLWESLGAWGVGRGNFPIDSLPFPCQCWPAMNDPVPVTPPPAQTTNALLEILYKKADWELEEKLLNAADAFEAVIKPLGRPHMIQVGHGPKEPATQAIYTLRNNLLQALKDKNRQAHVEDWMNKNNQVLAMLREFESQQA